MQSFSARQGDLIKLASLKGWTPRVTGRYGTPLRTVRKRDAQLFITSLWQIPLTAVRSSHCVLVAADAQAMQSCESKTSLEKERQNAIHFFIPHSSNWAQLAQEKSEFGGLWEYLIRRQVCANLPKSFGPSCPATRCKTSVGRSSIVRRLYGTFYTALSPQ